MNLLQPLVTYVAEHLVATAAIGGLTVAGGAVVVDQVIDTPDEIAVAAVEDESTGETTDEASTPVDDGTGDGGETAEDTGDEGDETPGDAGGAVEVSDETGDDTGDAVEVGDETEQGRSAAVHAVLEGGEVTPGSREFGRAVAEAASEGRSEQRGRSAEAPGRANQQLAPEPPSEPTGDASTPTTADDADDDQQTSPAPRERGKAANGRPAPGDPAEGAEAASAAPRNDPARGRG